MRYGLQYMMYADDTQLYVTCRGSGESMGVLEQCLGEIRLWMWDNLLVLNDGKTESIKFSSRFAPNCASGLPGIVRIGDVDIHPSATVNDLGVVFDSEGTMSAHVSNLCKKASFALWKIGKIRSLLDSNVTQRLVHAFVTSRLDCCDSLLFGIHANEISKIQSIQNSAARLVMQIHKYDSITPFVKELHWLPYSRRIKFKFFV